MDKDSKGQVLFKAKTQSAVVSLWALQTSVRYRDRSRSRSRSGGRRERSRSGDRGGRRDRERSEERGRRERSDSRDNRWQQNIIFPHLNSTSLQEASPQLRPIWRLKKIIVRISKMFQLPIITITFDWTELCEKFCQSPTKLFYILLYSFEFFLYLSYIIALCMLVIIFPFFSRW